MKKTYQQPEIETITLQTTQMLASSPGYGGTTEDESGNLAPEGRFFWDD